MVISFISKVRPGDPTSDHVILEVNLRTRHARATSLAPVYIRECPYTDVVFALTLTLCAVDHASDPLHRDQGILLRPSGY